MPSLSTAFVGLQGVFGILNGSASLLFRRVAQHNIETLNVQSLPAIQSIALGSISIGTFYSLAAWRNDTLTMWLTIPGRLMAVVVFSRYGGPWKNVAIFEATCAIVTGLALLWDGAPLL